VLNPEANAAGTKAGGLITSGVKKVIGAAAVGAALGKSLTEGANLEQSIGGIETLFGKSADKMIANADKAFKTAGISANTYMEQATSFSASLLQSTGGNTQKAAKAANMAIIDMSDNANKMGSNIQDIQNAYQGFAKQNYTMLDNLKLGYGGTKTEMQRLLTDAEKLTGKKYDINNLKDVYEAIHVMQGELGIAGTSAKEASTTLSGSFAAMKAAASNFLGDLALGRNIGPAMVGLAETAGTFLFDNLIPAIGNVITSLPEAISALVQTGLPRFIKSGQSLIDGLVSGLKSGAPKFTAAAPEILQGLLSGITARLPSLLSKGREIIVNIVTGVVSNIPALLNSAGKMITQLVSMMEKNLPVMVSEGKQMISQLAQGIADNMPAILAAAGNLALTIVKAILKYAPMVLRAGFTLAASLAKGIGTVALSVVKAAASKVASAVTSPIRSVVAKVKAIVNKIKAAFNFSSIAGKVRNAFNAVKSAMTKPIESAKSMVSKVLSKIKGLFPLHIGKIFSGLQLPHISVSGGSAPYGIDGKGSLPHFSVSWYKKAMNQPYMFQNATLFGAGEAGDEIMYGRQALMRDITKAVAGDHGREQQVTITNYVTVDGAENPEQFAERFIRKLKMDMRMA
jgi:hypothetical protein